MGNILNDIVEEIEIKPSKSKFIIKVIITIAISLIGISFGVGQFKINFFNRMNNIEGSIEDNSIEINEIKKDIDNVNERVDRTYLNVSKVFEDYQDFNKRQLILILDHGQDNKDLLKEIIEINSNEKTKIIQNQLLNMKK